MLAFGLDAIAVAFEQLSSPSARGLLASVPIFGALLGAAMANSLVRWLGAVRAQLLLAAVSAAGAFGAALAGSAATLIACRAVTGWALGLSTVISPALVALQAPAHRRGSLGALFQVAITLGIVAGYVAGIWLTPSFAAMFALGALPALALAAVSVAHLQVQSKGTADVEEFGIAQLITMTDRAEVRRALLTGLFLKQVRKLLCSSA